MHTTHASQPSVPTIRDVCEYRERIFVWLQRIAENDELLSEKIFDEMCDLFNRINESILSDNYDSFGILTAVELKPDAIKLFETLCAWGEITFHEQSKKYRRNLN